MNYTLLIWMHSLGTSTIKIIRQIQKLADQAITGAFSSVAEAIAEAEAHIHLVRVR